MMPIATASSAVAVYSSAQWLQFTRTRRWATIPMTVERIRKCGMPRSSSRVTDEGASLVWRVRHQVPGQRGLDGVLRRLGVADLADHDDVRILPQHGAERRGDVRSIAGRTAT